MHSRRPDHGEARSERGETFRVAAACTIEIRSQVAVLGAVVFPIVALILPSAFCAFAVYVAFVRIAEQLPSAGVAEALAPNWGALWAAATASLTAILGWAFVRNYKNAQAENGPTRLPVGAKGELLKDRVAALWAELETSRAAPEVVWFANFGVLAHARSGRNGTAIEVSSGLWERVVAGDSLAEGILAHEMAHLVRGDPQVFAALGSAAGAARLSIRIATLTGLAAMFVLVGDEALSGLTAQTDLSATLLNITATVVLAGLVLLALPLGSTIVRRHCGLISALMEMRADVLAALWTSGLARFAKTFETYPARRQSTLADVGHSLFSPNLTHLSEAERINLLYSRDRLITPKIRYFAFSIALPFLLPTTAATYLIAGGAFDQALVTGVAVIFQLTTAAMLLNAGDAGCPSWRRVILLGVALCFAQALPRINLASIGYFLTNYAVAIAVPGGFGSPTSWEGVFSDACLTGDDVFQEFLDATYLGWFFVAAAISAICLKALAMISVRVRQHDRSGYLCLVALAAGGVVSVLSSYDSWRDEFFRHWPLSVATQWFALTEPLPWLRLCAPVLTIFLTLAPFAARVTPS